MEVIEIKNPEDESLLAAFCKVAVDVYQNDPVWVPQSESVFQQFLMAWQSESSPFKRPIVVIQNDRSLARAAAIMPIGVIDTLSRPQGYIAFFECLPGFAQAGRLALQTCEDLLRRQGAYSVQAPRLDNNLMGLLVKGFDLPHAVLTTHNPPYYRDIFLTQGYQVREYLCSYMFSRKVTGLFPLTLPGIRTRTFNRACLEEEVRVFNYLNTEIFRTHPGYILRNIDEERQMVKSFLPMLDDDLIIVAETSAGNPVGFLICLPDIYQAFKGNPVDSARLITIGAIPSLASKGIGVLMGLHLMRNLFAKGYQTMEASWIRETNAPPKNLAKRFKGQPGREFALFEKIL
jgi:hypothetical protein